MRIPERLALAGRTWAVRWTRNLRHRRQELRGLAVPRTLTIRLDPAEHPTIREQTLIHEVLHVIWPEGVVSRKKEEALIEALEGPLHRFLEDNAAALWPRVVLRPPGRS